jgi:uncharacterized membrane protein YfcA
MNYWIAGFIGLLSGITSGMFGVGGGIVMVPAMMLLFSPPIRDIKQAIGTSLVIIIPTAIMGSFRHQQANNIQWQVVLWLVPTAIIGSYLGVYFTTLVSADSLKKVFGAFLILVGSRILFFKG